MCSMPMVNANGQAYLGQPWWLLAEKVRRAPAACIPSQPRCGARPGEGQATFQCREESLSRRGTECLFEVGQDVVNVLNTNGQAYLGQLWWSPAEKTRRAPAACAPSLGAARPGEGQATFQCREALSLSRRGTECLFEAGQDVVNVLNANGQRQWTGVSWPALWSPAEKMWEPGCPGCHSRKREATFGASFSATW